MELRSALPFAITAGALLGVTLATQGTGSLRSAIAAASAESAAEEVSVVRWDIPVVWNESVARFVNLFEHKQQDRMALYLKRSGRYEGMIRGKLRERGMPEDLLYLSMIESGFNPTARSKAQAVGLWQFIADTGRRYGLRVDGYVDERRDPEKSTDAALRYLQDLHDIFGSWNLAAAAYNTGEGRVARIMREETGSTRGDDADFWRIRSRLPSETREYIPLMFAAALIGKEPAKYGLDGVERWLPVPSEKVEVPGSTDLTVVARALGVEKEIVEKLNPQLLRGTTPPGAPYEIRIPDGHGERFATGFPAAQAEARVAIASRPAPAVRATSSAAAKRHQVRSGESLSTIARRHGTSVAALQRLNSMGRRTTIKAGQVLRVRA
ncbi:MAG: transglycosylase SLT domain-containing protein [Gemmatimonadetes bacterium]|nr:transglycosylase SLT domain-containing protein [Gemmatimonadota bacterium]